MEKEKTFKFFGYSTGDRSVGINSLSFEIDTGLNLNTFGEQDKKIFTEEYLTRSKLLNNFEKRLNKFKPYNKKISYLDFLNILTIELIEELHDNGKVFVYDNWINKED